MAHPGLVALTAGLASVPALLTLALGGDDLFAPLVLAGLVVGAALGWAVDDPAAALLASMPIGAPLRAMVRVGAAALVAGTGAGLLLLVVEIGPGFPPAVSDRGSEAAAAASAALAVGLLAARRGERAAGSVAVTCGVLTTAFVAGLSVRFRQLPSFLAGPHHDRWWLVVLVTLAVALHAGRDAGRR